MSRIFLTYILPEHLIAKHHLSFAACNFSFNLMSGGGFDKVYSMMPTFTRGELEKEANEDSRFELIYNNSWRNNKFLCRFATFAEQWQLFRRIPRDANLWIYNLNILAALLVILLKFFKPSVKTNIIVLDFTPVTSGIGINSLCLQLINSAHSNICLADSNLFKCTNRVIIPGVVPADTGNEPIINKVNNRFLLSGALNETIAQTSIVLEAFSKLPQCELHITGVIEDKKLIEDYIGKYANIIYHGKVSFSEYLGIMHSCTYQLSTRDEHAPENLCNFPSKIIEALLHNRIIISTITYPQLEGIKYFKASSEVGTLVEQISEIVNYDETQLMEYANQGKLVAEMFSTDVWNNTMTSLENK